MIPSLAKEGGIESALWAGPEKISSEMRRGEVPIQGTRRTKPVSLRLGFAADEFCYAIDLGLPVPDIHTAFNLDPIIKRECLWRGPFTRSRDMCVDRRGQHLRVRPLKSKWQDIGMAVPKWSSMLADYADPTVSPEVVILRDMIRTWRFYDHFRSDQESPARRSGIATRTPVLSADGSDLPAALRTIMENGSPKAMHHAISDAFPGSQLTIDQQGTTLGVRLRQDGMLRDLTAAELSDGTLRYLLLIAALLSPRPPELMVLNEPESSLHPELLPALGRLIVQYGKQHQIFVVTHSEVLKTELRKCEECVHFELEKSFGETQLLGIDPFDLPRWEWPKR